MKSRLLLFLFIGVITSLSSCEDGARESSSSEMDQTDSTESGEIQESENTSEFDAEKIELPDELKGEYIAPPANTVALLGLPEEFTTRDFLTVSNVGNTSLDGIGSLSGAVVKKITEPNGKTYFMQTGKNFRNAGIKIEAVKPSTPVLLEKSYNRRIGSSIKFLIGGADFTNDVAYQILINDVAESRIETSDINLEALKKTYKDDPELKKYFIITSAKLTSLYYKKYSKADSRTNFSYAAIQVNGSYYKDNTDILQDWKVGIQPIPVSEIIK